MNTRDNHIDPKYKRRIKDTDFSSQDKIIFDALKDTSLTASQIEILTGVKQKNICRYKRNLEKAGKLWQVKKVRCPITGHWAWSITTDPDKIQKQGIQLDLFDLDMKMI
jgi:hypothetical protein